MRRFLIPALFLTLAATALAATLAEVTSEALRRLAEGIDRFRDL